MSGQSNCVYFLVIDRFTFLVLPAYTAASHMQPRVSLGAPDVLACGFIRFQRLAVPVLADLREQTVLDWIPLGGPRRIMAHRHPQAIQSAEVGVTGGI